jgi:small GTP-binding protein
MSDLDDPYDTETKIVLIGKSSVGKTSIVSYAISNSPASDLQPTIGASFSTKAHDYEGRTVLVQIWDTAGHERFRSMTPLYFRGARVVLIVFALNDTSSFDEVVDWSNTVNDHVPDVAKILVGNKLDLPGRTVTVEAAEEKAKEIEAQYVETSAMDGTGINHMFDLIAQNVLRMAEMDHRKAAPAVIPVSQTSGGCC